MELWWDLDIRLLIQWKGEYVRFEKFWLQLGDAHAVCAFVPSLPNAI